MRFGLADRQIYEGNFKGRQSMVHAHEIRI